MSFGVNEEWSSDDNEPLIQFVRPNYGPFAEIAYDTPDDSDGKVRGRKRPRNEANWEKNKKKLLRNSGKSYETKTKKIVPEKYFNPNFDCKCRKKCLERCDQEDLSIFFHSFWKLADFSKQNIFLRGLVKMSNVHRKRPRDGLGNKKTSTFDYTVRLRKGNITVCKVFFLGVLQISWGRLYRCLVKEEVFAVTDNRGKNIPVNKIDDADVIAHIKSFPSYHSHYSRKDNDHRRYLNPDLNIRKMYDLYVEKCSQGNKEPVKKKFYYKVFSTKFNLHFKIPSKDTCRLCDELHLKMLNETDTEKKKALQLQKNIHLARAEQARAALKTDQQNVSNDFYVSTFDLQKALPFPKLSTSIAYYKRNLYVYNFGIHSFNENTGFMYVWDETEGGRGAQDLASCIIKHLKENASTYKTIILFSDSCTGQNRNIKMSLSLLKLVNDPNMAAETIDLKFMASGHSFLPNDAEFGVIEATSRKHQNIFVPQDWFNIIKNAKRKEPRYKVFQMKKNEFLSTRALEESIINRKKDTENNPVNWLKIRWLRFQKGSQFSIQFKENLNDIVSFRTIDLNKTSGPGRNLLSLQNVQQLCLYVNRRPITLEKKNNINDLMPYILPVYHSYFKNLPLATSTRAVQQHEIADDEIIYDTTVN